jgi:hypothetical protein
MASVVESLLGMLSGDTLGKISQQIGAPQDKTRQALPDVLALLTGAMAKNSSQQDGAQALSSALAKDHDGSILNLNNLSDYISNYKSGDGNAILGHVLGDKRSAVEQGLSQKSGLDMSTIGNLLVMAAPLIMGALGKTQKQDGLNAGSLSNLLGNEQSQAQNMAPGIMDLLTRVLGSGTAGSQGTQTTGSQNTGSNVRKRSPLITIIIVLVIAVVVYFILRYFGIL